MDEIFKFMNETSVYIRRPSSNVEMTTLSDSPLLFYNVCLFVFFSDHDQKINSLSFPRKFP